METIEGGAEEPIRELRRNYHDRIASLRESSLLILAGAVDGTVAATRALVQDRADAEDQGSRADPEDLAGRADLLSELAAQVDAEVLDLLALESPMARDLRVILTARDIAQIGLLCIGLCRTLAERVPGARVFLDQDMTALVQAMADDAHQVLETAHGAWTALDPALATSVFSLGETAQRSLRAFLAAVVRLTDIPIDAAIDLGLAARVYQRLEEHGVEVAERVIFAAQGVSPGISRSAQ